MTAPLGATAVLATMSALAAAGPLIPFAIAGAAKPSREESVHPGQKAVDPLVSGQNSGGEKPGAREETVELREKLLWTAVAVVGAISFAVVALTRGEPVNAAWLVVASVCIYFIAYRFYALFIAADAYGVDANRVTPAYRHNDGLDYVPTNRYVLFGHHFAAIAGAGPLVGPVLAAQMGYLPGTLWILAGVVFAGAVQDMTVLFLSTRRDGKSLGEMIRTEIGPVAGGIVGVGILLICIILLAVLALVVVNALKGSPWGAFTCHLHHPDRAHHGRL